MGKQRKPNLLGLKWDKTMYDEIPETSFISLDLRPLGIETKETPFASESSGSFPLRYSSDDSYSALRVIIG